MNNYAAYPPPQPALGPLRAVLGAFGALALTSATVLAATHPPAAGLYPPGLHQLYLAGRNLSLALGVSLMVVLCQRARLKRRQAYVLLGAVSLALGASTLLSEVQNFAETLLPWAPRLGAWVLALGVSGAVVVAAFVGRLLDRPRWRWLAVATGLAVLLVHPFVLATGYPADELEAWATRAREWARGDEPGDLPRIVDETLPAKPRDVFIQFISAAKERNPAAAMALQAVLARD